VTAEGDPRTQEEIDDRRGESRWPSTVVLLVAIAVPLLLPHRFGLMAVLVVVPRPKRSC